MQTRNIAIVAPSLSITVFQLADIDVDIFINHTKSMKPTNCVFIDNEVVYTGLFDSTTIATVKKKLKRLTLAQHTKDTTSNV